MYTVAEVRQMKDRVKHLRKTLGQTQAAFADKIGLTRTGYSSVEGGDAPVQERHIKLILAAYPQVSEHWLRTGEGDMFIQDNAVSQIMKKYCFADIVRKMLEAYEELDPDGQEVVLRYTQEFVSKIIAGATANDAVTADAPGEIDIDAEVERYRSQLLAQRMIRSSQSHGTEATETHAG